MGARWRLQQLRAGDPYKLGLADISAGDTAHGSTTNGVGDAAHEVGHSFGYAPQPGDGFVDHRLLRLLGSDELQLLRRPIPQHRGSAE